MTASQTLAIVDCDIHPAFRKPSDLHPFLPARWREHMTTFGEHLRQGLSGQIVWPRMMAAGMRLDAFPRGGPPGSDLALMRRQHLDANGVEYGMLMQLSKGGMEERNLDFAAALSHAINDWQLETWVRRSRACTPASSCRRRTPAFAVAEIERRAADRSFVAGDHVAARRATRSAIAATGRSTRRPQRCDLPLGTARPGLQRRPRLDRLGLADLLHAGALRLLDRPAEHRDEPDLRGRVRALPGAQGGA